MLTQKRRKAIAKRVAIKLHGYPLQPAACRKAQTCLDHIADTADPDLDDDSFVKQATQLLQDGWKPKRGRKRRA